MLTAIVRNGWDQATDTQRKAFAVVAPSVFSTDELVGLFDNYTASRAGAAAAPGSTIDMPAETPDTDAVAGASDDVTTQAVLGCTVRDRWGSYQFVGGSHNGQ